MKKPATPKKPPRSSPGWQERLRQWAAEWERIIRENKEKADGHNRA